MNNIYNIKDYYKKEVETNMDENLNIAMKNGFNTYDDYCYSIAKELAVNPAFSLNKEYQNQVQTYLKNTLNNFINYKQGFVYKNIEITVYALNELITEIYKGNEELIGILDSKGLSIKDFLKLVYSTSLDKISENNLGLKRGIK